MAAVLIALAVVVVVAIAVGTVGVVSQRLAATPAPTVYDVGDAVDWIADRLPAEVAGRLSYDDVDRILNWQLDHLAEAGSASEYGEELGGPDLADPVAELDEAVDAVVARGLAQGEPIEPVDVVVVLDLCGQYLRDIGAVGPEVTAPGPPDTSPESDSQER